MPIEDALEQLRFDPQFMANVTAWERILARRAAPTSPLVSTPAGSPLPALVAPPLSSRIGPQPLIPLSQAAEEVTGEEQDPSIGWLGRSPNHHLYESISPYAPLSATSWLARMWPTSPGPSPARPCATIVTRRPLLSDWTARVIAMIELHGLQKVIGQQTVIDIPALRVEAGEIAALVGPAGSGKGTLLDLLIGRIRPSAGRVRVAEVDPRAEPEEFGRRVGVLFFDDGLYSSLSPLQNLRFFCRLQGLPATRADEVLEQVGLADQARAKLRKLPAGLLRRLAFGRTILHHPSDLVLMEPFARCDEPSISLLANLLRQLADAGAAVLILAEDAAHLAGVCDRVDLLQQGRVVASPYPAQEQAGAQAFKIPVRLEGSVALVNPAEIHFAEAEEGRAFLVTVDGRMPTQFTLSDLEQRLGRSGFFRAHRGYLVNLQHIKEVIPFTRNSFSLRLDDAAGTLIPLSKTAAAELRGLLGY